ASSDFVTICEQKLPVVIAIHHDQRIGMIDNMLTKAYGRAYATEIGRIDFVTYAEAFGAKGIRVDDPSELDAAWDAALEADGPVFSLPILILVLTVAAIAGVSVGYWTGDKFGRRLFTNEKSFWRSPKRLDEAHAFYEKHGGKALVLARFIPAVRTFVPIAAG